MIAAILAFAAANPPADAKPFWYSMLPFLAIIVVFFFLMTRSMRRQERERQALATSLKKGDEVLTQAGMYGTVISVSDTEDKVVVKIDDNTRVRMTKASIARNLSNEQAAKAGTPPSEAVTTKPNS
jgi:preprotein translocase subunit YajC